MFGDVDEEGNSAINNNFDKAFSKKMERSFQ